jgi:hypothetical protein
MFQSAAMVAAAAREVRMSVWVRRGRLFGAACLMIGMLTVSAAPAAAQDDNPNMGAISFSGGIDFLNAYFFRGIIQDDTGVISWPYGELGFALYEGDEGLTGVSAAVGTWNSLHTGDAGSDGPSGKVWYESDFYASLGLDFSGGSSLGMTYTAYTSPNGTFGTVKEIAFSYALDDSELLGAAAVSPYIMIAHELSGQADGGLNEGTYMELGASPGYAAEQVSFSVPIKIGLSLSDYYEGPTGDSKFGYFSIGGQIGVPLTPSPTRFGSWEVHGGIEFLALGDSAEAYYGDSSAVIGSFGIGLSY